MSGDRNESSLYRRIMRCKADTRREIVIYSSVFLLLIVLGILCFAGISQSESLASAMGFALFFLAVIGVLGFFSWRKLKMRININRKKAERVASLSEAELLSLEKQIEKAELQYKTFYMLDEFFYVPKIKLLIRYSDMRGFVNVIHKTAFYTKAASVKDAIRIEVYDKDGLVYPAWVKQWRKYEKDCRYVAETINDKIKSYERNI